MFYLFRINFDSILNHHQLKTNKSKLKKYTNKNITYKNITHIRPHSHKKKRKNKMMFSKAKK